MNMLIFKKYIEENEPILKENELFCAESTFCSSCCAKFVCERFVLDYKGASLHLKVDEDIIEHFREHYPELML